MPAKSKTRKPVAPASSPKAPIKTIKVGKRLEKVAREIKDADEFVEHVAGLSNRYRREYALQAGDAQAEVRQALRSFQKHASALAEWLQQANNGKPSAVERQAFDTIGTQIYGSPVLARPQTVPVVDWLTRASATAEDSIAKMKHGGASENAALRIAAEGLRATFEHHKLKVAVSATGDAVRLLCAIAKDAGDASVEADVAKVALRDSNRRGPPQP